MIRRLNHNNHSAGSEASYLKKSSGKASTGATRQKSTSGQEKLDQFHQSTQDKVDLSTEAKEMLHYFNIAESTHQELEKNGTIQTIAERLCFLSIFMRYILSEDVPLDDVSFWTTQDFLKPANDLVRSLLLAFIKENHLPPTTTNPHTRNLEPSFVLSTNCFYFQACDERFSPDLFSIHFDGHIRDKNQKEASPSPHFSWQMTLPPYPENSPPLTDNLLKLEQQLHDIFGNPDLKTTDKHLSFFVSSPFFDSEQADLKISIQGITLDSFLHERDISLKL